MCGPYVHRAGNSNSDCASSELITIYNSKPHPTGAKQTAPEIRSGNSLPAPLDPTHQVFDKFALRGTLSIVLGVGNTNEIPQRHVF